MMALSVVIPTYQRRARVARLLERLREQTLPADRFEVIVAVDGSDDGTRELVAGATPPYALHGVWQNHRGRAAACNAGFGRASGDVIVLLDDDVEPEPRCLAAHFARHASADRTGVVGAVPVVIEPDSMASARYIAARFRAHLEKLARPGFELGVRDFYSGNFSIRRDVLAEAGGFDEAFTAYGNEDVELAIRLQAAGVALVYAPDAAASQHYDKDFAALARDHVAKGRTAIVCAAKHPGMVAKLRIGSYANASWKWKLVRGVLLGLTRFRPALPDRIIALMTWLERRRVRNIERWFEPALDYLYWVGARSASPALGREARARAGGRSVAAGTR